MIGLEYEGTYIRLSSDDLGKNTEFIIGFTMTQKSLSRIARDAAKANPNENQQTWEEVHQHCIALKLDLKNYASVGRSIDPSIYPFIEDQNRFVELCRILKKDLDELTCEIDQLTTPFMDRRGVISENDFFDFLPLVEKLFHFGEKILDVVHPISNEIASMVNLAIEKKQQTLTNGGTENA